MRVDAVAMVVAVMVAVRTTARHRLNALREVYKVVAKMLDKALLEVDKAYLEDQLCIAHRADVACRRLKTFGRCTLRNNNINVKISASYLLD